MSALTERKKREIEMLYRKLKEKPSKVFLNIFVNIDISNNPHIIKQILNFITNMEGVEFSNYTQGTNNFTATAQWKESDAQLNVEKLKRILLELANAPPEMVKIQAKILYPVD
jgi:hypothetical protein